MLARTETKTVDRCPIQEGYEFYNNFVHMLFVPKVEAVGKRTRVADGWVVPVKFADGVLWRGRCAILRHYADEGIFAIGRVVEHLSENWSCQFNLSRSAQVPEVCEHHEPNVLKLYTVDHSGFQHYIYLTGLLGTRGIDRIEALGDGNYDTE